MRRRTKVLAGVALAAALSFATCVALWPERFVVNAPVRHLIFGKGIEPPPEDELLARLRPPAGARVSRFAAGDLPNARFLRFTATGDLLVSSPRAGDRVFLLERDADGDGAADGRRVLLDGLNRPHGLDAARRLALRRRDRRDRARALRRGDAAA